MAIDFTLSPELEEIRLRVRTFINDVVKPGEVELERLRDEDRAEYVNLLIAMRKKASAVGLWTVSYTHLRAHETPEHLVCRLLLEKKTTQHTN